MRKLMILGYTLELYHVRTYFICKKTHCEEQLNEILGWIYIINYKNC